MGEANFDEAKSPGAIGDPAYQKAVFEHAYEQACLQLNDRATQELSQALSQINKGKNEAIDEVAAAFASENGAECGSGCSFCCHQMVLCTPFEVFDIARHILDTRSTVEIAGIKERLAKLAPLPLEERSRRGSDKPCALLEDGRCSIYEQRPSLCRTMLSTSRAACEINLQSEEQTVPFIPEPVVISFLIQLGIDYALIKQRQLSTEKVEMSRALLSSLETFEALFSIWMSGKDAFPDCHVELGSGPCNHDLVQIAAEESGVV